MNPRLVPLTALVASLLVAGCSDRGSSVGEGRQETPNGHEILTGELAAGGRVIGTVRSVFEEVTRSASGGNTVYALPDVDGQPIELATTDYFFDGIALSMTGGASADPDASFILKGEHPATRFVRPCRPL